MIVILRDGMYTHWSNRTLIYSAQTLSLEHKQPIVRPNPDTATIVLKDGPHERLGESVACGIDPQPVAAQTQEAAALSSCP
jgi:hypothetical protein